MIKFVTFSYFGFKTYILCVINIEISLFYFLTGNFIITIQGASLLIVNYDLWYNLQTMTHINNHMCYMYISINFFHLNHSMQTIQPFFVSFWVFVNANKAIIVLINIIVIFICFN